MNYDILQKYDFEEKCIKEFKIKIEEHILLVIISRHINGYFIAIPELRISCEALSPQDIKKNTIYLAQAGVRSDYAEVICEAISKVWE